MVSSCSAYGCKNRWNKDATRQFHRFPLKNPELLLKWLLAVKRKNWQPTKTSVLCSDHFTDDSYKSNSRHFLKDDAVPSVFSFTSRLQKVSKEKRLINKYELKQVKRICQPEDNFSSINPEAFCEKIFYVPPFEGSTSDVREEENSVDSVTHETLSNVSSTDSTSSLFLKNKCSTSDMEEESVVDSVTHETLPNVSSIDSTSSLCLKNKCSTLVMGEEESNVDNETHETLSNVSFTNSTSSLCLKNKLDESGTLEQLRRKVHNLQKKLQRREKKIANLETLLSIVKRDVSDDTKSMLLRMFGKLPLELVIHH